MKLVPQWVIEKKRDGQALSKAEIDAFIQAYATDALPDYQMAAMAMAIYLNGMDAEEVAHLTLAMMHSGDVVDTSAITIPKVDKHSTGGIGDKVSLILAPLVACCGLAVPMISGRGLGITGGTLDKMEAIPGYNTRLSEERFLEVVQLCGCSIIGQTARLAPADKKLYALRDVTAPVPSIPLITASIMCKKLAEGLDALVLDVKWGKGAFMKTIEDARQLAQSMVDVGTHMGKGMAAIITDMNEPLGHAAGNAVEILETVECLKGGGSSDLMDVTMALSARMLTLGGLADHDEAAMPQLERALASGEAFEKFKEMVRLQGGDEAVVDHPERMCTAAIQEAYPSTTAGTIHGVDADCIGRGVLLLGAGRERADQSVDHAVGVSDLVKVGDTVAEGDRLFTVHANDPERQQVAAAYFAKAFDIRPEAATPVSRITEIIEPKGR
jgi:pyrimidine-nucleoside phosphorylase